MDDEAALMACSMIRRPFIDAAEFGSVACAGGMLISFDVGREKVEVFRIIPQNP